MNVIMKPLVVYGNCGTLLNTKVWISEQKPRYVVHVETPNRGGGVALNF